MPNIDISLETQGKGIAIALNDKFGDALYSWSSFPNFTLLKANINQIAFDGTFLAIETTTGYKVFNPADIDTIDGSPVIDIADAVSKLKDLVYDNMVSSDATLAEQQAQTAALQGSDAQLKLLQFDAAGSLEVSQKTILFNGLLHNNAKDDLFDFYTSGTATIVHDPSKSGVVMSVSQNGDVAIRKTYRHFAYFAGKSQKPEFTFSDFGLQADVYKRFGYFSASTTPPHDTNRDGYYLVADGVAMTHRIVVVNNDVEQLNVERANWDDSLDGTGASGVNIDFDNFTITPTDFLWLGGKILRIYLAWGNQSILVHSYDHSKLGKAGVMFQSPFQPVTFEIRSVGGAGSLTQICSTVATESNASGVGSSRSFDSGNTPILCASPTSQYLIAAVRLSDRNADASLLSIAATEVNKRSMRLRVLLDPVIVGKVLTWNSVGTSSSVEGAIGDPAGTNLVTGGEQIDVSFQEKEGSVIGTINSLTRLGTKIDGTPQIIALAASPINGTNAEAYGGFNILENN